MRWRILTQRNQLTLAGDCAEHCSGKQPCQSDVILLHRMQVSAEIDPHKHTGIYLFISPGQMLECGIDQLFDSISLKTWNVEIRNFSYIWALNYCTKNAILLWRAWMFGEHFAEEVENFVHVYDLNKYLHTSHIHYCGWCWWHGYAKYPSIISHENDQALSLNIPVPVCSWIFISTWKATTIAFVFIIIIYFIVLPFEMCNIQQAYFKNFFDVLRYSTTSSNTIRLCTRRWNIYIFIM